MNKITSIVGLVLITAAGIIVALTSNYADIIKGKKELCKSYITKAQSALDNKNYGDAQKFAKEAIKADPENRAAYDLIAEITKATVAPASATEKKEAPKPKKKISIDLGC